MNHSGTCRTDSGACFNCGSFDHKEKDYPNPNNALSLKTEDSVSKTSFNTPQTNKGASPRNTQAVGASVTSHAYAMWLRDDQYGQDVVVVKFELFGLCVFTLFLNSTHSYICSSLVLPENVKFMRLNYDVFVESPSGYKVVCN